MRNIKTSVIINGLVLLSSWQQHDLRSLALFNVTDSILIWNFCSLDLSVKKKKKKHRRFHQHQCNDGGKMCLEPQYRYFLTVPIFKLTNALRRLVLPPFRLNMDADDFISTVKPRPRCLWDSGQHQNILKVTCGLLKHFFKNKTKTNWFQLKKRVRWWFWGTVLHALLFWKELLKAALVCQVFLFVFSSSLRLHKLHSGEIILFFV